MRDYRQSLLCTLGTIGEGGRGREGSPRFGKVNPTRLRAWVVETEGLLVSRKRGARDTKRTGEGGFPPPPPPPFRDGPGKQRTEQSIVTICGFAVPYARIGESRFAIAYLPDT